MAAAASCWQELLLQVKPNMLKMRTSIKELISDGKAVSILQKNSMCLVAVSLGLLPNSIVVSTLKSTEAIVLDTK